MYEATRPYSTAEIELLLEQYTPLVKATAWRYRKYKKYGVETEDLVQEGYMALSELILQCRDRNQLAGFLKNRLPGYVRAAAEKLKLKWGEDGEDVIDRLDDETEYYVPDETNDDKLDELELDDICVRALSGRHLKIVRLLLKGYTRRDIAEELNISHQAVNSTIAKIKKRLAPHLEACRNEGETKGAARLLWSLLVVFELPPKQPEYR